MEATPTGRRDWKIRAHLAQIEPHLRRLAGELHDSASERGFMDGMDPTDLRHVVAWASKIAGEAMEIVDALEKGDRPSTKIPTFSIEAEELADTVIQALTFMHMRCIPLCDAIAAKAAYNDTRPYLHGKKL